MANTDNVVDSLNIAYPKQKVYFFKTNVLDKDNVIRSFREAITKFQFIDIVIGNAGILNENDYEKTILINLVIVEPQSNHFNLEFN